MEALVVKISKGITRILRELYQLKEKVYPLLFVAPPKSLISNINCCAWLHHAKKKLYSLYCSLSIDESNHIQGIYLPPTEFVKHSQSQWSMWLAMNSQVGSIYNLSYGQYVQFILNL
jgi:hypothetical protein